MSNKIIIFNVWWAMASFCEIDWKKIVIDLWKKDDFSPTLNFLLPYAKSQNWPKSLIDKQTNKYHIDQLIVSHPHKDHISDIQNFHQYFYPQLVTTPNDNVWMDENEILNWNLIIGENPIDQDVEFFKNNLIENRKPPLKAIVEWFEIYYIPPKHIEEDITPVSDYPNNTSLICIIKIWWQKIMLPWDIMPKWVERMMKNNVHYIVPGSKTEMGFENAIKKRNIEILIAPHHGLESAFCTDLMNPIKDTLKLVIIPEKPTTEDDKRQVDSRYYSWEYWSGIEIYDYEKEEKISQWAIKTSVWHIILSEQWIIRVKEIKNLINAFNV